MKMIRLLFLLLVLTGISTESFSQLNLLAKYRIEFKDKNNTPYSLSVPSDYLSPRAIQRRTSQGISIDSTDIPVNQTYINGVLAIGGTLLTKSKWFNCITIALSDTTLITSISALPYVFRVERTYPPGGIKTNKSKRPRITNTQSHEQLAFNPYTYNMLDASVSNANFSIKAINYGLGFNQANMIGVDYLHALGYTGDGMIIAVIDAGFYNVNTLAIFDSIRNSNRILGTRDFVNPGNDVYTESNHGMAVLSIMGGNIPGQLVGTAPHASYWLLRTEDAGTEFRIEEDNWIAAAEFADSAGVDVINTSLGYTEFYDPSQDYTYADMNGTTARITKGTNMATSKGMFCVNSAGNSGNSPWKYIGAPADAIDVLAVGAVDASGVQASFSSHGPSSDGRVKPNVTAQGQGTMVVSGSGTIGPGNGTSFSGPVVAGAVACLWQANPQLTNIQLKSYIEQSASLYPLHDSLFGYGIPNFAAAHILVSKTETPEEDPFVLVYPNPFDDELFVIFQSEMPQTIKIEIVDMNGRKLTSREDIQLITGYNNIAIDRLKGKSNGIYFLRVITQKQMYVKRIIKL
jgi:serine protease AprX